MPVEPWVEPDQDDAAGSTKSKIVYMMISFTIGIMTFLVYMLVWYLCTRHRRNNANRAESVQLTDTGGLSKKAMAALPTIIYKDSGTDTSFDCVVCLGQIEGGEKVRKLPCNHWFHLNCIDMWLYSHSTCPICRHDVTDVSGRKKGETSIRVGNPIVLQTGRTILPV